MMWIEYDRWSQNVDYSSPYTLVSSAYRGIPLIIILTDYLYGAHEAIGIREEDKIRIKRLEVILGNDQTPLRRSSRSMQYKNTNCTENLRRNSDTSEEIEEEARVLDVSLPISR